MEVACQDAELTEAQQEDEQDDLEDDQVRVQRLLKERWVAEDQCRWTIFEDLEDELSYHRRRSRALCCFVRAYTALQQDRDRLQEAGLSLQDLYEQLQDELNEAVGDAAYWRELAKARKDGSTGADSLSPSAEASEESPSPEEPRGSTSKESPLAASVEEEEEGEAPECVEEAEDEAVAEQHEEVGDKATEMVTDAEAEPDDDQEDIADGESEGTDVHVDEEVDTEDDDAKAVDEEELGSPAGRQHRTALMVIFHVLWLILLAPLRCIMFLAWVFPFTCSTSIIFLLGVVFKQCIGYVKLLSGSDLVKEDVSSLQSLFMAILGALDWVSVAQDDLHPVSHSAAETAMGPSNSVGGA